MRDAGDAAGALALGSQITDSGDPYAGQARAAIEIECGEAAGDAQAVRNGIARLTELSETTPGLSTAYNRANGHEALWQMAIADVGVTRAYGMHRSDLHRARDLFAEAGADGRTSEIIRCQAFVNVGISLSTSGRHADALRAFDEALAIEPTFAMAHGNRGSTLLYRAGIERVHRVALVHEAMTALDQALARPEEVLEHSGPGALSHFRRQRNRIPGQPNHRHDEHPLDDPHLEWCRRNDLFVHSSPVCITRETEVLDQLPLGPLFYEMNTRERQRVDTLMDALNSVLQDYVAARYLSWSVLAPGTSLRDHTSSISDRVAFFDTLGSAQWGVSPGLLVSALASATNLLDKVASVAHLYLRTGQPAGSSYFRNFGFVGIRRGQSPSRVHATVANELEAHNYGMRALFDLACELERRDAPLPQLFARRNAATHRAVAVHTALPESSLGASPWLDRVELGQLEAILMDQLHRARSALFYLADLINDHERRNRPSGQEVKLPTFRANTA